MERFDHLFTNIAQQAGGIQGLLEAFFSFLLRRTDFYYEADPGDKMGFPPGVAEKMILAAFRHFQEEHFKKHPRKNIEEFKQKAKELQDKLELENKLKEEQKKKKEVKPIPVSKEQPIVKKEEPKQEEPKKEEHIEQTKPVEQKDVKTEQNEKINYKDIETRNGGINEKYKWDQTVFEVSVQIDLPRKMKGKELNVTLTRDHFKAVEKANGNVIVEGEFFESVKRDESTWTIDDGTKLMLDLVKADDNIWKTIFKGDAEIDTSKVDNSKKMSDFDEETQGGLRKVLYEQNRKQRGLPTTEEEQQNELLKKAWNSEGSPFKGTPFDPSKLNIPSNQNFGPNGFMG